MRRTHLIKLLTAILFFTIFTDHLILAADWKPATVTIKTKDNVPLKAYFEKPSGNNPVVVMLHGLASSKEEWLPFAEFLHKQGWGILAYDARGHGESSKTKDQNGAPNGYQYFGKPGPGTEWVLMIDDVGAMVSFLKKDQKLESNPIDLCGASVGANVSANYASLTHAIHAMILLSPGMNYASFEIEEPMRHMKNVPTLLVASAADTYAYESCSRLSQANTRFPFWSDVKPGHGVQMLDEALMKRLLDWLSQKK